MTEDVEVKIDELYESKLDFETIIDNPILQPISKVNTIYRSQSLIVQRALWEFEQIKIRMDDMIKLNPVYNETLIFGEIQQLINTIKQIIHSQDVQRGLIKETINEMVNVSGRYYSLSKNKKEEPEIKKVEEKLVPGFYSDVIGREVEIPDYGIERPKKGRQKKEEKKEEIKEVKEEKTKEIPKINGEEIIDIPKIKGPDIIWDTDIDEKEVG
ncbi:MAG: hypothetical protein WC758_07705 [Candidatus Woesearchaeota archaeon]|jgi:hypothetical protein